MDLQFSESLISFCTSVTHWPLCCSSQILNMLLPPRSYICLEFSFHGYPRPLGLYFNVMSIWIFLITLFKISTFTPLSNILYTHSCFLFLCLASPSNMLCILLVYLLLPFFSNPSSSLKSKLHEGEDICLLYSLLYPHD